MTDLTDKLADVIGKNVSQSPRGIAHAIIAALPGMVKPLEWSRQGYESTEQIGHHAVPYSIYESPKSGACVFTSGSPYFFGPEHTSDLEAAKAIANAYHRAAIMAALGVEGE